MSKQLLCALNGDNRGAFWNWLQGFEGEPRIAWYPSAGEDFRDLLYLHSGYSAYNPGTGFDPKAPDLFLHTDYYPWDNSTFLKDSILVDDGRTTITIKTMEELPRCDLPTGQGIVHFPEGSSFTGRVVFMVLEVKSHIHETFTAPVLYVFAENGAFCASHCLPLNARFSHIIHIRYGSGFGGSSATGVWLLNVLDRLGCECFITDGHYGIQSGDKRTCETYPELAGPYDERQLEPYRTINGRWWSNHGDVSWNLVQAHSAVFGRGIGEDDSFLSLRHWSKVKVSKGHTGLSIFG